MVGGAETWYYGYSLERQNVIWEDLVVDVCSRLRDEMGSQFVEEFKKLSQIGAIDEYVEQFEELKSLMLVKNPRLPDDYFVDSFIGGLTPQIKSFIKAFKPKSLSNAVNYARLHEATVQAIKALEKLGICLIRGYHKGDYYLLL